MQLGIDIGTSKIAVALVMDGQVMESGAVPSNAKILSDDGRAEQDPARIYESLLRAVGTLSSDLRREVTSIGVTNQMHGAIFMEAAGSPTTPLITWQDDRVSQSPGFLEHLRARTDLPLYPGYGITTLVWLLEQQLLPTATSSFGTVGDWLTMKLVGGDRPVTDPTGAAGMGGLDRTTRQWDQVQLARIGIPSGFLPEVVECGTVIGELTPSPAAELGLPPGAAVTAALGDNQASLLATIGNPDEEVVLTLGTGGQVSVLVDGVGPPSEPSGSKFEYRPFPNQRWMAAGSILAGGAAWKWLARTVGEWIVLCSGQEVAPEVIYDRLNLLGAEADREVEVDPAFRGERFAPAARGTFRELSGEFLEIGPLTRGLARGIFRNLRGLLPEELLKPRTKLIGSGNGLRKNPLLRAMAESEFKMPLQMQPDQEEAAVGAAILARFSQAQLATAI